MELLAPAGSVDHFEAAVQAGADGVYVGAPGFNARNPAREFRFDEIRAMAACCREQGLTFYVALNSLVKEEELPRLITTLAELESISPTALIVQDLGVIELVTTHFPSLPLHGSTLMFVHHSGGVKTLARLGCSRVVLARELTIAEIEKIVRNSPIEVEIFVHGAMCFSYSGGCLFSSYHGGKSGLRGNCVQPCRRKYSVVSASAKRKGSRGRSAYFFSMNDLEGLDLVDEFKRIGVASLKIEGRLRSVNYVEQVVRAYRMVMDAAPSELEEIRQEAKELIGSALGRKSSTGFFLGDKGQGAISSHHSGNIGTYLGRFSTIVNDGSGCWGRINLKQTVQKGERFRLHDEASGERVGFTLRKFQPTDTGDWRLQLPSGLGPEIPRGTVSLYRVDVHDRRRQELTGLPPSLAPLNPTSRESATIRDKSRRICELIGLSGRPPIKALSTRKGRAAPRRSTELWVRLDSAKLIFQRLPFEVDRFVLPIEKRTMAETGQLKRYFGREKNRVIWALPQVVHDQSFSALRKKIEVLRKSGFRTFQITGLGQLSLFAQSEVTLYGDYTLNLLNSRAMKSAASLGLSGFQFSIETDRASLSRGLTGYRSSDADQGQQKKGNRKEHSRRPQVGLTVYGTPPLFISRAAPDNQPYNQTISSPHGERFVTTKRGGLSYTRPVKPYSLLPFKNELQDMGIDYLVVDFSGMKIGKREVEGVADRLTARDRLPKLPTFNYLGRLE